MAVTIAVLITYHNEGPLLTECLDSLRRGGSQPDEVLIYDDASDIPPEPYIPAGMPVRVITGRENRGPSCGRNALLKASGCTYIHFHDADDLFAPAWCESVRAKFGAGSPEAVFTDVASFYHGQESEAGRTDLTELAVNPDLVRYCLSHGLLVPSGTYLRKRVLDIGGYSESYWQSEDFDFHIRLGASGLRFGVIPQPLVRIRLHDSNRSKDHVRVWSDGVKILEALAGELEPEYLPDVCDALARAGRVLFHLGARAEAQRAFTAAKRVGRPELSRRLHALSIDGAGFWAHGGGTNRQRLQSLASG